MGNMISHTFKFEGNLDRLELLLKHINSSTTWERDNLEQENKDGNNIYWGRCKRFLYETYMRISIMYPEIKIRLDFSDYMAGTAGSMQFYQGNFLVVFGEAEITGLYSIRNQFADHVFDGSEQHLEFSDAQKRNVETHLV